MEKNAAAEEKLLQLIRKNNVTLDKKLVAFKSNFLVGLFQKKTNQGPAPKTSILNTMLMFLIVVVLASIIYRYVNDPFKAKIESEINTINLDSKDNVGVNQQPILSKAQELSFYEQSLKTRDVFRLPWEEPEVKPAEASVATTTALSDLIKIKGIMIDRDPRVVLEETSSQQTFILSIGESIDGAVIKSINADKIIFDYNNQQVELTP